MYPKINVLAFAAHPDDAEISISGILLKHKSAGLSTGIIDMTRGELGTRGNSEIRTQESERASVILKLDIRENLELKDGFFEQNEDSLMAVIKVIRKYRPDIVLLNAESDRHPDHGKAHELVKRACFLSGLVKIKVEDDGPILDAWKPQTMYSYIQDYYLKPDIVIDVSEFWNERMESMLVYSTQFYNPDSKDLNDAETSISTEEFIKNLEGRSYQFGRMINCSHAEGLRTVRPVGINLLTDLL